MQSEWGLFFQGDILKYFFRTLSLFRLYLGGISLSLSLRGNGGESVKSWEGGREMCLFSLTKKWGEGEATDFKSFRQSRSLVALRDIFIYIPF